MTMSGPLLLFLRVLFAVGLYAFLVYGLYILWLDARRQVQQMASRLPAPLSLAVLNLPEVHSASFTVSEVLVGRDPGCSLRLDDITVSARHARLLFRRGQWWLEDLQSTNGTFINQEAVKTPVVVTAGDEIRCGQVRVAVDIASS